jgi:hypothetical protein
VHAFGRPPQRAPYCAPLHYERHRPEQTTMHRLMQQHAASFIAHTEANTGSELPRFITDDFDAFLECGILAHGFLRLRCGECGHDKLLAFSCKRRGFCPSFGARRMSQTPPTWWTTSSRTYRCGDGCCRCRCRCACCWPRNPSWSRRCFRWCSAWSRAICWVAPNSRPTKATTAPSH